MARQEHYDDLLARLDVSRLPQHIGVIMDGNGRWARSRGQARTFGHKEGAKALRRAVEIVREIHIPVLTVFAFSTENWRRPETEVDFLMRLLSQYLRQELPLLQEQQIRLHGLGDWSILPIAIRELYAKVTAATAANKEMTLNLAVNYGARQELVQAARSLAHSVKEGEISTNEIDEEMFAARLDTGGQPELDLLIRPAGELRLSNFLLWQAAYAELYFTPQLWPEFSKRHMLEAIVDFQNRERRFGRTKDVVV
ncbi:MAG: isoprenyl transferase [Clostridiales bacterium]|nr:isoprenyl transferase [Clostridiales bacterium]